MKGLYLDLSMGVAGDMLASALYDLMDEPQRHVFLSAMNSVMGRVSVKAQDAVKCGIHGSHLLVEIDGREEHKTQVLRNGVRYAIEIDLILDSLALPKEALEHAREVFQILFEAESQVHAEKVENIHLHEVGSLDAILDITAAAYAMQLLGIEKVEASAVNTGQGQVKAAHGILPVPAPATAAILIGVPIYSNGIEAELTTPTGAALVKHYAQRFGPMGAITPIAVGYGMGTKDFEAANCVRAFLYEENAAGPAAMVSEISANIDDMTPEALAFACEAILSAGALDVFVMNAAMKKGRAGHILTCLCEAEREAEFAALILRHTSTIGLRAAKKARYILERSEGAIQTPYGAVRSKISSGYGVYREKAEYEDMARLAKENGLSLEELARIMKG